MNGLDECQTAHSPVAEGTALSAGEVVGWVFTVTAGLRRSQAKTLADLVAAAARVAQGALSAVGRRLPGPTAVKHRIKRVWRFCANDRVHIADAMAGVIRRLAKRRKKPLLVALDWTDIRSFHTLMAAAVLRGRAVPPVWATYTTGRLHRSRNSLEEGCCGSWWRCCRRG